MTRAGLGRLPYMFAAALAATSASCSGADEAPADPPWAHLPYAQEVVEFSPRPGAGFHQNELPDIVLGPPESHGTSSGSLDVLSLGAGGEIVLGFGERAIVDRPGPDLVVFENAFYVDDDPSNVFAEPGEVSVSEDGETFVAFPCDTSEESEPPFAGCAGVTPTLEFDAEVSVPLDPELTGGDAFDLADLGLASARFVRVRDVSPNPGEAETAGFDLDAVGIIQADQE